MLQSPIEDLEITMAKGQMRSNREKKKSKQDKNKKAGACDGIENERDSVRF